MKTPIVEIHNVSKVFRSPAGEFAALRDVSACFYQGEFVSVVGKSGSGKSTLVNMITGIDRPTGGEIVIAGTRIRDMNESAMSAWRGRSLGIVFQFYQLLPMLTLLENVTLPMDLCDCYEYEARERRALELLDLMELKSYAHSLPGEISGGQQQSAAIARALANDPPILIADEPTGNLDSKTAAHVFELFAGLIAAGKTILMVTHDRSLAERTTRILEIADGVLVGDQGNHAR